MQIPMKLPSRRWTSFDGWDYNGMKERLQVALGNINKPAFLRHAERIKGQKVIMSEPFSAGQYWICFEMIAEDDSLVIARVRLPRHPDMPATVREEDETYGIACEVATMEFVRQRLSTIPTPRIGSVCSISPSGEPVIGSLAASSTAELRDAGPFSTAVEYFTAIANAAAGKLDSSTRLGGLVFGDILDKTALLGDMDTVGKFPLNHMDLGTQNILVDDNFNFLAIIDWEFAQTAPWQVNHYPMPFPLMESDIEDILRDPSHLAYKNVLRQDVSRRIYRQKFQEAERKLEDEGRALEGSFADTPKSPASRIYACFTSLGRLPQADRGLMREMVRFALGLDVDKAEEYL